MLCISLQRRVQNSGGFPKKEQRNPQNLTGSRKNTFEMYGL